MRYERKWRHGQKGLDSWARGAGAGTGTLLHLGADVLWRHPEGRAPQPARDGGGAVLAAQLGRRAEVADLGDGKRLSRGPWRGEAGEEDESGGGGCGAAAPRASLCQCG